MKVKEIQLTEKIQPGQKLCRIDDNPLHIYLKYMLEVFIIDSTEQIISDFLGANIGRFDIILGRPWLKQIGPFINWENNYWTHCQENDRTAIQEIALLNAQEFEAKCSNFDIMAYMIAITEIDLLSTSEYMPKSVPSIPSEYADLAHDFLEDMANKLPEYRNHDLQLETTGIPFFWISL